MKALARVDEAAALAPDMIDVAGLILGAGRGQPPAAKLTLIDAAIILLDRARADLNAGSAPAPVEARGRRKVADSSPRPRAKRGGTGASKAGRAGDRAPAVGTAPTPSKPPAEAGKARASAEAETVTHNGVTVSLAEGEESVEHGGAVMDLTTKQARLVACLARAMPEPVGRDFIAKKVWAGSRVPEFYEQLLSSLMSPRVEPLASIGLTIKSVRGVGIALQKAGE